MLEPASGSIHVLHVDDDPEFAEVAATFLERHTERIDVEIATNAGEGIDRLRGHRFDCVVSDFDMPGRDGIEFLRSVREDHPDLPFILYTGKGSEEVASDAISAGVTEYLQKEAGTSQYEVLANRITNAVEKYHAQHELQDREERLNLFFEQSPLGVIRWDDEFNFARLNDAAREILGYDEGELVGQPWEVVVPEENRDEIGQVVVADLLEDRGGYHSVNENVRKNGERITCEWHNWEVTNADDEVVAVFSQFHEITDEFQRERQIAHEQSLFHAVLETSIDGILVVDQEREYVTWNQQFIEMWGVPEDLIGDQPEELGLEWAVDQLEDPEEFIEKVEYLYEHPHEESRDEIHLVDGRVFDRYSAPVEDEDGTQYGRVWFFRDITERKEHEAELRRQNRRLEEFASVVSHDLRNPLSVAQGRLELAAEDVASPHHDSVKRAHQRMEAIIEDLLSMAREGGEATEAEPVDLPSVLEDCWQTVETTTATLAVETAATIRADPDRLKQLLENLIRNAVEHGGEDVTVTVGDLEDGFYVEDDGVGIPRDEREQVFETGYSTREHGTGFGLSIVVRAAEAHGWAVDVTESASGGARFEFSAVERVTP